MQLNFSTTDIETSHSIIKFSRFINPFDRFILYGNEIRSLPSSFYPSQTTTRLEGSKA